MSSKKCFTFSGIVEMQKKTQIIFKTSSALVLAVFIMYIEERMKGKGRFTLFL